MRSAPGSLRQFTVCGWTTVGMTRSQTAVVEAEAHRAHPDAASLVSCQRLEALTIGACDCPAPQRWTGDNAILHVAEVAAGLHSAVLGEEQILAQVRVGLAGATGAIRDAGDLAVGAARELRRATNFESHAGHLLDRALKVAGLPASGRLVVIGTGAMGRLVARRGAELGFQEVIVAGRARPVWLAGESFVPLGSVATVGTAAVVTGCLGSAAGEIDLAALPPASLYVDLGTPLNFAGSTSARRLSIADLMADEATRPHATRRRNELRGQLRAIVERRLREAGTREETPVAALRFHVERIRQRELERMRRLHPELDPATLDTLTNALVNQLFHAPSERLKGDPALAEEVLRLFAD